MRWNDRFLELFERCLAQYKSGNKDFASYYSEEDLKFLASFGYRKRELFDFVEDYANGADLSPTTSLLVAAVRRDYFQTEMDGKMGEPIVNRDVVPAKKEQLGGIAYLPRILAKARAKLRGELDPDLMFSCGGDRGFLKKHGDIHPADFLRHVWAADGDDQKILAWLKEQ